MSTFEFVQSVRSLFGLQRVVPGPDRQHELPDGARLKRRRLAVNSLEPQVIDPPSSIPLYNVNMADSSSWYELISLNQLRTLLQKDELNRLLIDPDSVLRRANVPPWLPASSIAGLDIPTRELLSTRSLRFVDMGVDWFTGSGIGRYIEQDSGFCDVLANTILYIRPSCLDQIEFIHERAMKRRGIGVIAGPPGTGKSITAFLSALMLAAHQNMLVLWIHMVKGANEGMFYNAVLLDGPTRFTSCCKSLPGILKLIKSDWGILEPEKEALRERFLFIDGYVKADARNPMDFVTGAAIEWYEESPRHHICVLSSMTSACILSSSHPYACTVRYFNQYSWKFEDYETALSNSEFKRSVATQLFPRTDTTALGSIPLEKLEADAPDNLKAKYFYAGGCARFMFQHSTKTVEAELGRILESEVSIENLREVIHGCLPLPITEALANVFGFEHRDRDLLSPYVKQKIAAKLGSRELCDIVTVFPMGGSMKDWIFKEYFFLKLSNRAGRSLTLSNPTAGGAPRSRLPGGSRACSLFNPAFLTEEECLTGEWLRPVHFDQKGYDAIFLKPRRTGAKKGTAIFVKCSVATSHGAQLSYCKDFLMQAEGRKIFKATHVEFYFVVPEYARDNFTISAIESADCFSEFRADYVSKWESDPRRVCKQIRIRALPRWDSDD